MSTFDQRKNSGHFDQTRNSELLIPILKQPASVHNNPYRNNAYLKDRPMSKFSSVASLGFENKKVNFDDAKLNRFFNYS